jgi:SAM-dependent methyltransferase
MRCMLKRGRAKWVLALLCLPLAAATTYPAWKGLVRQNRWFVIASNIGNDSLRRMGLRSGQIGQETLTSPPTSQIPAQVARMRTVYDQYLRYSGLSRVNVAEKRILELGPGPTLAIPLLFASDGASFTVGVDRFIGFQTSAYYREFYARLRDTLEDAAKLRFDRALQLDPLSLNTSVTADIEHRDLPDVVPELGPESFDLLVSNAVMEEIYDPTPVLAAQDRLLRPGGAMVHLIDLRDYGMFSKHGFHPLEFLTVRDWVYRLMVECSGQPDRRLIGYYRNVAARMGYQYRIYTSRILGHPEPMPEPKPQIVKDVDYSSNDVKLLDGIRPRLQPQFRSLPDEDLLAQSIIFVAWKPAASTSEADRSTPR